MDEIKEKLKVFERMHQELKQDTGHKTCENTSGFQNNEEIYGEYSYWQNHVSSKPLQDLDMWFDFGCN